MTVEVQPPTFCMHGESNMNITKYISITTLWILTVCTLTTVAGCTAGQGPNAERTLRIDNKTSYTLVVTQGTAVHRIDPGKDIDLIESSRDIVVTVPTGQGRLDRVTLKFNPGNCPVNLCVEAR